MSAPPKTIDAADAAVVIARAERVVVVTGAGISTDSGIPDYRGPNGLWTKDPSAARYVDLPAYLADAELRAEAWQRRISHPAHQAQPNAAHRALVRLHQAGRLRAVLTQNIDGLHQSAGLPDGVVLELHGNIRQTECVDCGRRRSMAEAVGRVQGGEIDPDCRDCGGILKSATVFFGQSVDPDLFARAGRLLAAADLIWVIGSSLRVAPIAGMVGAAAGRSALLVTNAEPTPYDDVAVAVVRDPIGAAVPQMVRLVP
ncbi:MAG: SIR2 family NAD-dependent protein deacylase [Jatrophihabitans sp.]